MTRRTRALAGAAALAVALVLGGVVAASAPRKAAPAVHEPPANTAAVERGKLSAMDSQDGTLSYRARPDGSPYAAINQAAGTYTALPGVGEEVGCGDVLYRVDEHPVLLLCGTVPAYRALSAGDAGRDVRQLNRSLHVRGDAFTAQTEQALAALQRRKGVAVTGALAFGAAVYLPRPVRISKVTGTLGGPARPGAEVVQATSDTLEVQMDLSASRQDQVQTGDRARIALPGLRSVTGTVQRIGRVATSAGNGTATVPVAIGLDDPRRTRGLDRAPVQVEIATKGVEDALSVPATALVGRSGGGFAVEVARDDGRRELVAVRLGLFDTGRGRVEVEGDLAAGDRVVVPSL